MADRTVPAHGGHILKMAGDGLERIQFVKFVDERGVLVPIEGGRDIPFDIKRLWYIRDVPHGETRGGHAHKQTRQVIIAQVGAFRVSATWRAEKYSTILDSDSGLYVPPGVNVTLSDFAPDAVCLVLADTFYDEEEYI